MANPENKIQEFTKLWAQKQTHSKTDADTKWTDILLWRTFYYMDTLQLKPLHIFQEEYEQGSGMSLWECLNIPLH